jgi:transposase-like protein
MSQELLTTREAARRLGISTASLYAWLAQSNAGTFVLHGRPATIEHLQGGAKGQGRILITAQEIERLKDLMRVRPRSIPPRRPPVHQTQFPGISVKLGRPEP